MIRELHFIFNQTDWKYLFKKKDYLDNKGRGGRNWEESKGRCVKY